MPRPGGLAERARAAAAPLAYLDGLNPEQRDAVEALDGPVLVLAGAGTGKTRVLTTRIAHLLTTGRARPSQILAVTFTNKAAREMKDRVGELVGGVGRGHALARHVPLASARRSCAATPSSSACKSNFTILDTDDQIRLMKQIIQAENIDEKRWPAAPARRPHRRLEEPRPLARPGAGRRSRRLRPRARRASSTPPTRSG